MSEAEAEELQDPEVGQGPEKLKEVDTSEFKNQAMDLTSSNVGEIDEVEASGPLNLPDPDYLTNFCKNRNTPADSWFTNMPSLDWSKREGWGSWIVILLGLGIVFFVLMVWYFIKYYELIIPFIGGSINIMKYLIIYSIIIVVMVLLLKFTRYFSVWYKLFYKYLRLTFNPLLDDKVSQLYCFFSDYVNPLIYYPSMIFFLFCLIGVVLLLVLILLPILAAVSFFVGFLFSLLGEKKTDSSLQTQAINKVRNTIDTKIYSKNAGLMGSVKAAMTGKPLPVSAPVPPVPPKPLVEFKSGFINLSKKTAPGASAPGVTGFLGSLLKSKPGAPALTK